MVIKIILIFALLQYISFYIFKGKKKSGILCCGIFGQATDKVAKLNVSSIHLLGIYNIERGRMSCGLTWDGDIQHGLDKDKLYTDFILDREIKPVKIPTMIGHTRQPSAGATVNADNAHPFGFGTNLEGDGYEFIGVHNGTLKNHKELAEKYNIELTETSKYINNFGTETVKVRTKIDSEILLEILYRTKRYHVLSEYIGTAALAWTWINEPNKIYLWSGASKMTQGTQLASFIERPLCVYSKSKNNLYFSSIDKSLSVLGADTKKDLQIDSNTVYVITDGDFKNAEKHTVSRAKAGQTEAYIAPIVTNNCSNNNYRRRDYGYYQGEAFDVWDAEEIQKLNNKSNNDFKLKDLLEDKPLKSINDYKGKIYSKGLRYYKNGHVIDGIYIYVADYGFVKAGDKAIDAHNYFKDIKGKVFDFDNGVFDILNKMNTGIIPYSDDMKNIQYHYFVDGAMLRSKIDYGRACLLKAELTGGAKYINVSQLSHMSKHPIVSMNMPIESIPNKAMYDGVVFSGNITELGFEKVYYFTNGILWKNHKREDLVDTTPVIQLPMNMSSNTNIPSLFNQGILNNVIENVKLTEFNRKLNEIEDEIEDETINDAAIIVELISDCFERHVEDLNNTLIEFEDWKDNEEVIKAANTVKLVLHALKEYIEKPVK